MRQDWLVGTGMTILCSVNAFYFQTAIQRDVLLKFVINAEKIGLKSLFGRSGILRNDGRI